MSEHMLPREKLYSRFDGLAQGREQGDARGAYDALLNRLAANRRAAEEHGWTACALERAGSTGRLTGWGVPPGDVERHRIPDWLPEAP